MFRGGGAAKWGLFVGLLEARLERFILNELRTQRSGTRAKGDRAQDLQCLAVFGSDPRFSTASGQSVLTAGWQEQLRDCSKLRARYVFYSHGLEASQRWARELASTGVSGKWLAGFLGGERQAKVLPSLPSSLRLIGVCVPSRCCRRCEVSLGWHVLLQLHGVFDVLREPGMASVRAPVRGRVRLRLSQPGEAARGLQLIRLLEEGLASALPLWYLDPVHWPARPARAAFTARKVIRDFFREMFAVYTYRMHVSHQYRYGFCSVPKAGLMQFFLLNHRLERRNMTYEDVLQTEARVVDRSTQGFLSQLYWKNREWKFAIFVRDPLERFLSAFLDKCMQFSRNCPDTRRVSWELATIDSPQDEQAKAFRAFAMQPLPTPAMLRDDHWIPQSLYLSQGCLFMWQRIDFVGLLSSDRPAVNWQVFEMLHSVFGFSLKLAGDLADTYFPATGHASPTAAQRAKTYGDDAATVFSKFYDQDHPLCFGCLQPSCVGPSGLSLSYSVNKSR